MNKLFVIALLFVSVIVSAQLTPADQVSPFSNSGNTEMYKNFVKLNASDTYLNLVKATLASPTFTGTVTIPTPFTLGAVSVLPTGTELNFVGGVTSAIQT